jgi:hypothetical protein
MNAARTVVAVGVGLVSALTLACMPELVRTRTEFTPSVSGEPSTLVMSQPIRVSSTKGFSETIAQETSWKRVGAVPQGDVYKPVGTIFMLTSANAHEAYLVVSDGKVVGFYLPGEVAFAPASVPVDLPPPLP